MINGFVVTSKIETNQNLTLDLPQTESFSSFVSNNAQNIILLDFKSNETPWSIDIYSKKISNIKKILKQNNVHTRDVYPPLNSQKIYKHIKGMPVSNFYCKMGIWLPTSLDLKKSEIIKICKLINQIH